MSLFSKSYLFFFNQKSYINLSHLRTKACIEMAMDNHALKHFKKIKKKKSIRQKF